MIRYKSTEITVGMFIILAFTCLLFVTVQTTSFSIEGKNDSYILKASFENVSGLKNKAPVRIAGVKIGEVSNIVLNIETYQADTDILIYNKNTNIPIDSSISILTEGLLGAKYASINPGYGEKSLTPNSEIQKTYSGVVLESIISKALAAFTSKE